MQNSLEGRNKTDQIDNEAKLFLESIVKTTQGMEKNTFSAVEDFSPFWWHSGM